MAQGIACFLKKALKNACCLVWSGDCRPFRKIPKRNSSETLEFDKSVPLLSSAIAVSAKTTDLYF